MPVLKVLLILLLIFFPFGELIRFNLGNNIFLKPIDSIGVVILLWTSVLYIRNKQYRDSLRWYYVAFPLIGFISLGINSYWLKPNELITSFLYLLRWVSYLSIFFAVIQLDKQFRRKITTFLIVDGLVVLLIGYIQFFFYPALQNLYYQGWDNQLYRMFSSFLDPNFVGAFFVLYFIFIAGLVFNNLKRRKQLILYSIILAVTLIAIFLTYSRSALVMLIISGVTFFILKQKKKFILYLLALITLFVLIASPFFYLDNLNLFRVHSVFSRIGDIEHGLTIFKDHPLVGIGFNAFRYAQIRYHFALAHSPFPSHSASGTDNSFVLILATTGVLGFSAYCYLWYRLFEHAKGERGNQQAVFIASTIGLFISAFFNNSLFYPEIMVWMWLITALAFVKE